MRVGNVKLYPIKYVAGRVDLARRERELCGQPDANKREDLDTGRPTVALHALNKIR